MSQVDPGARIVIMRYNADGTATVQSWGDIPLDSPELGGVQEYLGEAFGPPHTEAVLEPERESDGATAFSVKFW